MNTVQFRGGYRPLVTMLVELLQKTTDRAKADLESLGLATMLVDVVAGESLAIWEALLPNGDDQTLELATKLLPTLRVGCYLYLAKLDKVREAQLKLGVEKPDDTDEMLTLARALADEATPQLGLADDAGQRLDQPARRTRFGRATVTVAEE